TARIPSSACQRKCGIASRTRKKTVSRVRCRSSVMRSRTGWSAAAAAVISLTGAIVPSRGFRVQARPVPAHRRPRKRTEGDEMAKLTADFLLERLAQNGVRRIYGYPGDGINAIVGALERHKDELEFVQVRHEEMAAFMACAHAKWTGEVGVCLATSGPGAIHLLNGLYDAKLDHQPVMAIVGQQARMGLGGNYQQEVDLVTLFKDVASQYVQMAHEPAQIRHLVDRAHRIALAERDVTCVIVPNDVGEEPAEEDPPREHGSVHSSPGFARANVVPPPEQLKAAAEILNRGEKVAMLVGQGALHATDE